MPMKCPYCGREMTHGYLQGGQLMLWAEKKHRISLRPTNPGEFLLAENWFGFGGATVEGDYCPDCERIVLDTSQVQREGL